MANKYLDPKGNDTWSGDASAPIEEVLSVQLAAGFLVSLTVTGNTNDFASSGRIKIDNEYISYTGKTASTLTGLTRGENASADVIHFVGATIYQCDASWDIIGPYATIAALLTEYSGNILWAASGYYKGDGAVVGAIDLRASGKNVIFDGDNSFNYCIDSDDNVSVDGIEFRNYILAGIRHDDAAACLFTVRYSTFKTCGSGIIIAGSNDATAIISKNVFNGNVAGITWTKGDGGSVLMGNTFLSNTSGLTLNTAMDATSRFWNNAFKNNSVAVTVDAIANIGGSVNWNGYHSNAVVGSDTGAPATYVTLANWRTATSDEINSLDSDPLFNDVSNNMLGLQSTSPWKSAGNLQQPIGAFGVAFGISANINSSAWGANGELDNTQVSGDNVILTASPSGTFASDVLDMGQTRSIRDIRVFGVEDLPDAVFDADNTDEYPNQCTIEVRGDDTTFLKDAAEAGDLVYDEFERGAEPVLVNGNAQRYVQVRVTLRDDGT